MHKYSMTLISDKYIRLNEQLHSSRRAYGRSGKKYIKYVLELTEKYNTKDVLDYGCGKQTLQEGLPFTISQYDPGIRKFSKHPDHSYDIVTCTDVLEHIEPNFLNNVLNDIKNLTLKVAFLVISTRPARKTFPDGRNVHLIIKPKEWWIPKLQSRFKIHEVFENKEMFAVFGEPINNAYEQNTKITTNREKKKNTSKTNR